MRITREQLYAAFDITDSNVVFVDLELINEDNDSIRFYKDGKQGEQVEINWDGRIIK